MIPKRIKILFVCPTSSTFIVRDLELLEKNFNIRIVNVDYFHKKKTLIRDIRLIYELIKYVRWADVTYSWFAENHAYATVALSKLFNKASIVVIGGGDVATVPEINYGNLLNKKLAKRARYTINSATKVLTVDGSMKSDAIKNLNIDGRNILKVPTGYDHNRFKPEGKKENRVITVGYISQSIAKRKGFETFIRTAKLLPHIQFILIGKPLDSTIETLKEDAPVNVTFTGFVSEEQLIRYYQSAKVYCQLSRYEGLPNALCEAMLCECVPVGTPHCGIPSAIGGTGYYVPYGDEIATAKAIKNALNSDKGPAARERIKTLFSIEDRERKLLQIIDEVYSQQK